MDGPCAILALPNELIVEILGHLDAPDLAMVAATCSRLRVHARADRLWAAIVQRHVPGDDVRAAGLPQGIPSFFDLYLAHHPNWFIPQHKLWMGSLEMTGCLLIARYDPRRGCIEGYRLLAENVLPETDSSVPGVMVEDAHDLLDDLGDVDGANGVDGVDGAWNDAWNDALPTVWLYDFEPHTHLHLDRPHLKLLPGVVVRPEGTAGGGGVSTTSQRVRPDCARTWRKPTFAWQQDADRQFSPWLAPIGAETSTTTGFPYTTDLIHARPIHTLDDEYDDTDTETDNLDVAPRVDLANLGPVGYLGDLVQARQYRELRHARDTVWPPPAIPTPRHPRRPGLGTRVRRACTGTVSTDVHGPSPFPERVADMAQTAFLMVTWGGSQFRPLVHDDAGAEMIISLGFRQPPPPLALLKATTFATIDPFFYTPTPTKPFRGIWVGDYGPHGCQFVLVHQPDDDAADDPTVGPQLAAESDAQYAERVHAARVFRGRLLGIKLTGDANVPRGEVTFDVPDLAVHRVVRGGRFAGARMAHALGQVAGDGFVTPRMLTTRILFASPDRLAQLRPLVQPYVSYFQRIDIDQFISFGEKPAQT